MEDREEIEVAVGVVADARTGRSTAEAKPASPDGTEVFARLKLRPGWRSLQRCAASDWAASLKAKQAIELDLPLGLPHHHHLITPQG